VTSNASFTSFSPCKAAASFAALFAVWAWQTWTMPPIAIAIAAANVLMRIVSALFRFIAGLFGDGINEDLESVGFAPGSAQLMPPMREQLQTVTRSIVVSTSKRTAWQ